MLTFYCLLLLLRDRRRGMHAHENAMCSAFTQILPNILNVKIPEKCGHRHCSLEKRLCQLLLV